MTKSSNIRRYLVPAIPIFAILVIVLMAAIGPQLTSSEVTPFALLAPQEKAAISAF